jgi:ABC-type nitrate/sulfonate/bicarbonate transport system substrate-binding protein
MLEGWIRNRFFAAPISCWFSAFILAAAPTLAADKLRVSYASVTGNTAGITYIAQRAGLFEKQGLDVELILITGGPASISALLNADVDLDMRAPVAALQAMAQGVRLTFYFPNRIPSNTTS